MLDSLPSGVWYNRTMNDQEILAKLEAADAYIATPSARFYTERESKSASKKLVGQMKRWDKEKNNHAKKSRLQTAPAA